MSIEQEPIGFHGEVDFQEFMERATRQLGAIGFSNGKPWTGSETFGLRCTCGKNHDVPVAYEHPTALVFPHPRKTVQVDLPCPVAMGHRTRGFVECPAEAEVRLPAVPLGE